MLSKGKDATIQACYGGTTNRALTQFGATQHSMSVILIIARRSRL